MQYFPSNDFYSKKSKQEFYFHVKYLVQISHLWSAVLKAKKLVILHILKTIYSPLLNLQHICFSLIL